MSGYILDFREIGKDDLPLAGGKGANLGELSRLPGISVPGGFCITTTAFREIVAGSEAYAALLADLPDSAARLREYIEQIGIPEALLSGLRARIAAFGADACLAVRSSATAEDLPGASFAGQQDTFLNIRGMEAVIRAVRQCWASLFTDRAVAYRDRNQFAHEKVLLSVVVQKMVHSKVSGILFTADPLTNNHKVISIDASYGLGEALVSGLVSADLYKVYQGKIVKKTIGSKQLIITSAADGGTLQSETSAEKRSGQALPDERILELSQIALDIQAHFQSPQDIEWALDEEGFHIVQSRPITTLYPVIQSEDDKNHIYVCMGHSQMMTDAMKPLGLSFFPLFGDQFSMPNAGGRLFLDASGDLAAPLGRMIYTKAMNAADPYFASIIRELKQRKDFMKHLYKGKKALSMNTGYFSPKMPLEILRITRKNDIEIVPALFKRAEERMEALRAGYEKLRGVEVVDQATDILKATQEVMYDHKVMATIFAGVWAQSWMNKKAKKWAGMEKISDSLAGTVDNNITSNMGLDLLDVSDVVRDKPAVLAYFAHPSDTAFFETLEELEGGRETAAAIREFLINYGVRCTGEIDLTRTRFRERPAGLVPLILNNIHAQEAGARQRITDRRLAEWTETESALFAVLSPSQTKRMKKRIRLMRGIIGFREYPKYNMMQCYWIVKEAFLREAERLLKQGALKDKTDIYYLTIPEFRTAIETGLVDYRIIEQRKEEFERYEKLTPPRILTSEGECFSGRLDRRIPDGAMGGIPVSGGTVEGRARVILKMEDADMQEGDILVTRFTDPSWTPVFVSISGLVTEVGGQMTHGSVIAREYGIPAVVSVNHATTAIKDGDRIRVNGSDGYVEICHKNPPE